MSDRYAVWLSHEPGGVQAFLSPFVVGVGVGVGVGVQIVIDIVDPHRHEAAPKWSALAQYAKDHPDNLRRVVAVIKDAIGTLRALDLRADGIGERVAAATDGALMAALFDNAGNNY